ncbi:ankyrin repeat domain-containing protein [Spongiimicrobium salis]|uniref:ankyrin repeat domain-containing protein n=1 Tax=Spongiimicrobium salis TaxID=1667022 RepID=UPI00374DB7C3
MIDRLKILLQNKEEEKLLAFIQEQPEVLSMKDDNGSSGILLIAYGGSTSVFSSAIALKTSFTFHEAIVCGKLDLVEEQLINQQFKDINTHSEDGFSPIALAAFFERIAIVKLLLKHGADPNLAAKNPSKVNALHAAVAKENYALAQFLLQNGARPNTTQIQAVTPLHAAVHRGNLALTKLLISYKASPSLKMDNGDTPLAIAEREGHKAIATYLKNHTNTEN